MRNFHVRTVIATAVTGLAGLAFLGCAGTPSTDGVARDFVAMTTVGDEVTDESLRGNVTIVDFWAVF